ncbi:hypothetical protein RclHR1_12670003 [Rhizophagus clarus]|uniref:Uncharacterized protein n=1 Tax=Rhizophagus clarus TaxID=94130 RepID=A0A2Z6Q7S9_9GLOM|nr:hypothetical protein RclHR1_12670003 [Rhizophagus clarus]
MNRSEQSSRSQRFAATWPHESLSFSLQFVTATWSIWANFTFPEVRYTKSVKLLYNDMSGLIKKRVSVYSGV